MFCSKCGTENPEGLSICRNCGFALISAKPPASRTSALAITSLVLGLLSFCTFFLTAPLAVILGIISLVMISKSKGQLKGTGMAIAGIVAPIAIVPIAILMAILFPALAKVRCEALQATCNAHLKQLGVALQMYADDNDRKYPTADKWCDLLKPYYKDEKVLICPSAKYDYEDANVPARCHYAINPHAEPNSPPDVVLMFETNDGWNQAGGPELLVNSSHIKIEKGCNILFVDGRVEFVEAEDVNELRWTEGP